MQEFKIPTETIELPSQGLLYPKDHPLSSGTIEMKYMTAREEDILANQNYIANGTVIDKLLKSLIVSKVDYNDLVVGDKNAIMIAARILGYGPKYKFEYNGEEDEVDLSKIDNKKIDKKLFTPGNNEFSFVLPHSKNKVTFKLLTHRDEQKINKEIEGLQKLNKDANPVVSTRLKFQITSVNGDSDPPTIRSFVDKALLAQDSRAFRKHISDIQPDIDLTFFPRGTKESRPIPIGLRFFWPDI
tara:strand:+ start:14856 stop:15584 length:729 start_codon:yes stop_codon:yes gene_type:complete